MKIRNLETFYWIAKLGSFRATSEKLNLTPPAISARIQLLEQYLGVKVFERDFKQAKLTPAGRKLFGFAERLMHFEQNLLAAFSDTTSIEQIIRMGSSETIIATWLPDFLAHLSQYQANLSFDLRVDSTNNLRNALVACEIDIAFLMGPVAEVSIANHNICSYEMIFAATPEIANQFDVWTLENIANQPIVTFASDTKPYHQIKNSLAPFTNGTPNMTSSTSLGSIIRLAVLGHGICTVPKAAMLEEIQKATLVPLETNIILPEMHFTASYVLSSPMNILIEEIIDHIGNFLKTNG